MPGQSPQRAKPEGESTQPCRFLADTLGMYTDAFLVSLWLWALQRLPTAPLVMTIDTIPSRYGPRIRA